MIINQLQQQKASSIATICDIGIANPITKFSQHEIANRLGITGKLRKFFEHDHIAYRHLYCPPNKNLPEQENVKELQERFINGALEITTSAITVCLNKSQINIHQIDFICCVTSTGFIVPSLSALIIKHGGFRDDCQRVDIVGMGCSAGLNGLNTVANWCHANPNKNALLICVEICSAIYTLDGSVRTAIVNSLFGDGSAVALLRHEKECQLPAILDFESHLIPADSEELRFDWDNHNKSYSFYVGRNAPKSIASRVHQPLDRLLKKYSLTQSDIKHWIVHGGGNAVLSGIRDKLHLSDHDLRHTRSVLKDFGNLSSSSFLFSFKRLIEEKTIQPGDYAVMMTMGPGLAIEMALLIF